MIEAEVVEDTMDMLIKMMETNIIEFHKAYKSTPFEIYSEIERLSVSKSSVHEGICVKARLVADTFHKNIR